MSDTDVAVVGAGIVGLATARALQQRLGAHVTVIDKEPGPARHQSGRNSGVVHSGLYYAPGSAKARLVRSGRELLERRLREWGVPYERCGKTVVATRVTELAALEELERRARRNGVEAARLTPRELAAREPHVAGVAALHVPGAAVTDFAAAAAALAGELAEQGAELRFGERLEAIHAAGGHGAGLLLSTSAGSFRAGWLVNCAGLHSDRVARMAGASPGVAIVPFRGEYHELTPHASHLVRTLVYPVPDTRWPFLGVHLTRGIDGAVHVGPNAVLALGREHYRRGLRTVGAREVATLATTPGLVRLARRYWRTGLGELLRSRSRQLLVREVRRLVPEVGPDDLVPSGAGIRAQAIGADGSLLDDFAFATSPRAVHVLNAPSPAATASLAIAEVVVDRLQSLQG